MAQNTMVWLLSKGLNDIATSGETPKFDIKWSLPIYDHLTDGTVMTDPEANPGPDMDDGTTPPSHNQSEPGDFNGIFYVSAVKYALTQWPSEGGYTALTETSGWAKNPEWSVTGLVSGSRPKSPAVGQNGNTKYTFGSVSGGNFVEGTEPMPYIIADWNTSLLYENVRYDGTSTEDPGEGQDPLAYAHYTVYLRCQEGYGNETFIGGDTRFNKVLLFTDIGGAPVPVAMVCLATPITLFANNQGQSNSLAISFQLGFNPNDTAVESVSFDNLYWTKVGEYPDYEGDMRLYSKNRIVLGNELAEDNGAIIQIIDNSKSFKPFTYVGKSSNEIVYTGISGPRFGILAGSTEDLSINPENIIGGLYGITAYGGNISVDSEIVNNYSLLLATDGGVDSISATHSIVSGAGLSKTTVVESVIASPGLGSLLSSYEDYSDRFHRIVVGSLIIGESINVAYPLKYGQLTPVTPDLTVAVGNKNKIYSGMLSDDPIVGHSSRTIIFGKNNQVDNSWSSEGWPEPKIVNGELADSYILGSCNALGRYAATDTSDFNDSQTKNYVFGNENTICNNELGGSSSIKLTNRYILGSNNTVELGSSATVTPDIYVFGSDNTIEISATSNQYGNNKYIFGSGVVVESWEEFVFSHCSSGLHDATEAHKRNSSIKLLRMGINQNNYALNFVVGSRFPYIANVQGTSGTEIKYNNLMLPFVSQVASAPQNYKHGTFCLDETEETIGGTKGFYKLYYWFPTEE